VVNDLRIAQNCGTTMTKLLTLIATGFLALTALLNSGADAGSSRLNLPSGVSAQHDIDCDDDHDDLDEEDDDQVVSGKRSNQSVTPRSKPKIKVPRRETRIQVAPTKSASETRSEPAVETSETENSSIATALERVAGAPDPSCKNYFASAGMTVSVTCEK
jgi:hypothetical protein